MIWGPESESGVGCDPSRAGALLHVWQLCECLSARLALSPWPGGVRTLAAALNQPGSASNTGSNTGMIRLDGVRRFGGKGGARPRVAGEVVDVDGEGMLLLLLLLLV